ncbi:MAG: xanthine dehydrogenase family protein subunit M [Rhizomicrobium sp.]
MTPFLYERAADSKSALELGMRDGAKYLGGGTNLVDLMREMIEHPATLVDVSGLSCKIEDVTEGGLKIGAGVKNTAVAADRRVRERFPMLAQAILAGASAQIRNMATVGGNILQRTRCIYFYDDAARCNKRVPDSGCDAIDGFNRNHAILGASPSCVATHPSDMCIALSALDATVTVVGRNGEREIPLINLHRLPGMTPQIETLLEAGELITAVTLPPNNFAACSSYRKVRDRASYAFALVSVAAGLEMDGDIVKDVRLALGGVAHKPWRAHIAESALKGGPITDATLHQAAYAELAAAKGLRDNAFKIELAKRVIVDSLSKLAQVAR